jgi:hypothetical protein
MTPKSLSLAAMDRKCVTYPNWKKPCSAAFVIQMQFAYVMRIVGQMKLYKPKLK